MIFDEAYSTNPEQIRRDRDRYLTKARRERAIAAEYFAAGTRRGCNHDRYDRCLSAASYHYDRQDNYVLAARRLNWRLIFCLRNRSFPL
jgi:hypothetical protein